MSMNLGPPPCPSKGGEDGEPVWKQPIAIGHR
jgi:hypothetical protein